MTLSGKRAGVTIRCPPARTIQMIRSASPTTDYTDGQITSSAFLHQCYPCNPWFFDSACKFAACHREPAPQGTDQTPPGLPRARRETCPACADDKYPNPVRNRGACEA